MDVYLIDTENVAKRWLDNLGNVRENSHIIAFYSNNSFSLTLPQVDALFRSKCTLRAVKCICGHNAMDFQLVTELGYLIATAPGDTYYIVSNDLGFNAVVTYWLERDVSVNRISPEDMGTDTSMAVPSSLHELIADSSALMADPLDIADSVFNQVVEEPVQIAPLCVESEEERRQRICKLVCQRATIGGKQLDYATDLSYAAMKEPANVRKQLVHSNMISKYGANTGLTLYRKLRPSLKWMCDYGYPSEAEIPTMCK